MSVEYLFSNGVNGATGEYLLPQLTTEDVIKIAIGEKIDPQQLARLKARHQRDEENFMGPVEGVEPKDLSQAGWGVIFPHNLNPAIREALSELLEHRRKKAGNYYREYVGNDAYFPGESVSDFLARFGAHPAEPADPENVPYYLLIVGDPEAIPYTFQYQLDVQYAVGRIYFEKEEEYAQYAHNVVEAETTNLALPCRARFFGVRNRDDRPTELSADHLVAPLAELVAKDKPNWDITAPDLAEAATKARLSQLLGGEETPALLFTASHGVGFPKDDPRQPPHQGALLCQEWPGPEYRQLIPEDHYFSADDVTDDVRLFGLIAFHFACYSAGTPKVDEFGHRKQNWPDIAPNAFVARLPQRLLSHPKGGALAVIGHVERAWGYSFMWQLAGRQLGTFKGTIKRLMEGHPVGSALELFNQRYAALSSDLTTDIDYINRGQISRQAELPFKWTANNDARGYAIIGDPAVRLMVSSDVSAISDRPTAEKVVFRVTEPSPASLPKAAEPQFRNEQLIPEADWQQLPASIKHLIENLVGRVRHLEQKITDLQSNGK